jgi:hypothetical protein
MMWAMLLSRRFERCLEICDAGTELAIRIGTPPVQYPTIKALALMELGRFGDAWQTLDREVADEAHRFGAALQALGRLQYEVNVGDYEAALDRAPHVIAESRQLARAWMLQWTCDSLAGLAPIHAGDAATLARIDALIADTGSSPAVTSRAALALARGDLLAAREDLTTPRPGPARVILLNADIIRPRLLAAVEAAEDRWGPASKAMGEAIDLARESNSRQQLWRLLGEAARIEEALGQSDAASATRVEARALMAEIAATIPDPRHRSRFLDGRLARQLGLVA